MADVSRLVASLGTSLNWDAQQAIDGLPNNPLQWTGRFDQTFNLSFGTGSGEIDSALYTQEELAAGASGQIDLFNLIAPQSNFNVDFAFATVKMIVVWVVANEDETASEGVLVGNALSQAFNGWLSNGGTAEVEYGGQPYIAGSEAGKTVDVTHRYLKIENLDAVNAATVNVLVFGVQN